MQPSRRWQLAIGALGVTVVLAACSGSATGGTAGATGGTAGPSASQPDTPAASQSVSCTQITALGSALANVSQLTVNAKTASQVSADLTAIENALVALKSDARSVYATEAGQIVDDLSAIGQEAQLLSQRPTATNRRVTKIAINEVKKAVSPVITEVRLACP
jgi:hypothetical protein